jgi:hypothetical protein
MTDDLVKRLRTMAGIGWNPIGDEAADRIEKLELDLHFQKLQKVEWACYACIEKSEFDAARIEQLEAALRDVTTDWDRWQKMKDSDSFTELFARICEAKALEGKND